MTRQAGEIQDAISDGAQAFLTTQYKLCGYFMVVFATIIFMLLGSPDGFKTGPWEPDPSGSGVERAVRVLMTLSTFASDSTGESAGPRTLV